MGTGPICKGLACVILLWKWLTAKEATSMVYIRQLPETSSKDDAFFQYMDDAVYLYIVICCYTFYDSPPGSLEVQYKLVYQ